VLLTAWALARQQSDLSNGWGAMAALSLCIAPSLYWQLRTALLRAARESFVAAARVKELPEWIVTSRYILPAAGPELAALAGLSLGCAFSASLLVECTMGYAGLGPLAWNAILARDLPEVVAAAMTLTAVWLAGSLAADLMQFALDPRTRRPLA
jgi:peptide/nickel transport system permease protein